MKFLFNVAILVTVAILIWSQFLTFKDPVFFIQRPSIQGEEVVTGNDTFGYQRDGFFVEVGAFDGETSSNTKYLERSMGFRGLLIEANIDNYIKLTTKNRRAYLLHAALAPEMISSDIVFHGDGQLGHIAPKRKHGMKSKCFPLYSILMALNVSFVDVFSLDIEGYELKILKTIPFNKLKFGILIVEYKHIPEPKAEMVSFMKKQGYEVLKEPPYNILFGDPNYVKTLPGCPPKWKRKNII